MSGKFKPAAAGRKDESLKLIVTKENREIVDKLKLAKLMMAQIGIELSMSELLTKCVEHYLNGELAEITGSERFKTVVKSSQLRIEDEDEPKKSRDDYKTMRLYLGEEDAWLAMRLDEVVQIKKKQGVSSSRNKEIIELCKAGLRESEYGSILRSLLRVSKETI